MTSEDREQLARWQTTDAGHAEMACHALRLAVADLKDAALTREGVHILRASKSQIGECMAELYGVMDAVFNLNSAAAE